MTAAREDKRGSAERARVIDADRFWGKVQKGHGCWLWTGAKNDDGYGHFRTQAKKTVNAHRFSYQLHKGEIPAGLTVMHACDVRNCVNPAHLSLGTHAENMSDSKRKGRAACGEQTKRNVLTEAQAKQIIREYSRYSGNRSNVRELADRFGVSTRTITCCANGFTWKHIPRSAV